jgi:hypothetical protein
MEHTKKVALLRIGAVAVAIWIAPLSMRAAVMGGFTGSSADPASGPDDMNFASTPDVTYQTFCSWMLQGLAAQFSGINFTFAGGGSNIGGLFPQIVESDFLISDYKPWVVNNYYNSGTGTGQNFFTSLATTVIARNVRQQDAGGANIEIEYTPRPCGAGQVPGQTCDPTTVNFVQSYVQNTNNNTPNFLNGPGTTDTKDSNSPFYNGNPGGPCYSAGTGGAQGCGPLTANPNRIAWIADIPYWCESLSPTPGMPFSNGSDSNCGGPDEASLSTVVMFQTFIESTQQVFYNANAPDGQDPYSLTPNGGAAQTWDVLYGGVQWGYSYSNTDIAPEPSSLLPLSLATMVTGLCLYRRFRLAPLRNPEATCLALPVSRADR